MSDTSKEFKKVIDLFYKTDANKTSFVDYKREDELKNILNLSDTSKQGNKSYDDVLEYLEKYFQYGVKTDHPQFLNRMWTGGNSSSIMGEIAVALTNTSACTYESAPVSTLMEKYLIEELIKIVGFDNAEGQMTTGSSNANMIAMMAARNLSGKNIKKTGVFGQEKLFAFVNEESHYSLDKAANILGIGSDNLIKIPAGDNGSMDISILEKSLEKYSAEGKIFFVTATAGTTVRGAYDNISELLRLKQKYNFWLHVDGAWGGTVFFNEKLRQKYLKDLENVDSFCFDFHKMLGTNLICNILLVNNKTGILSNTCGVGNTDYIFKETGEDYQSDMGDLGIKSLQCGRRIDSLKLFLDWVYYGPKGFSEKIQNYYDLVQYATKYIEDSKDLQLSYGVESFNICFTFIGKDKKSENEINKQIREQLYTQELSLVGSATIGDTYFLRLLISNENITKKDIDLFFENVISVGKKI